MNPISPTVRKMICQSKKQIIRTHLPQGRSSSDAIAWRHQLIGKRSPAKKADKLESVYPNRNAFSTNDRVSSIVRSSSLILSHENRNSGNGYMSPMNLHVFNMTCFIMLFSFMCPTWFIIIPFFYLRDLLHLILYLALLLVSNDSDGASSPKYVHERLPLSWQQAYPFALQSGYCFLM